MKKLIFLFVLLTAMQSGIAQNPDSLLTEIIPDSLLTDAFDDTTAIRDTVSFDPVELKKSIDNYISTDQKQLQKEWFPWWTYSANKHYITLKNPGLNVKKKGFTIYPNQFQNIHLVQSNRAFYQITNQGHSVFLDNLHYKLPVTITDTEAGMGDYDHTHGNFSIKKGYFMGSDSTGVQASVSGINGYWFGTDDTQANLYFDLFHYLPIGYIEFSNYSSSEEYSTNLSLMESENTLTQSKSSEQILYLHSLLADLGFRYETSESAGFKRNQFAALARKKINSKSVDLDISCEFIKQSGDLDSTWYNLNSSLKTNWKYFDSQFNSRYTNKTDYFLESQVFCDLFKGAGIVGKTYNCLYPDSLHYFKQYKENRYAGGIGFSSEDIEFNVTYGKADDQFYDDWFTETYLNGIFRIGALDINLRNWTYYFHNPIWQVQSEIELFYNLKYNNGVKIKFSSNYYSDYFKSEEEYILSNISYDLLIGMQVSNKFEIRMEMINLSGNQDFLGYPVDDFHYLYNMRWYFVN